MALQRKLPDGAQKHTFAEAVIQDLLIDAFSNVIKDAELRSLGESRSARDAGRSSRPQFRLPQGYTPKIIRSLHVHLEGLVKDRDRLVLALCRREEHMKQYAYARQVVYQAWVVAPSQSGCEESLAGSVVGVFVLHNRQFA